MLLVSRGGVNYCYNWLLDVLSRCDNPSSTCGGCHNVTGWGKTLPSLDGEGGRRPDGMNTLQCKVESVKCKVLTQFPSPTWGRLGWGIFITLPAIVAHFVRTIASSPSKEDKSFFKQNELTYFEVGGKLC